MYPSQLVRIFASLVFLILFICISCSPVKKVYNSTVIKKSISSSNELKNHFVGFALYDPSEDKYLFTQNHDKYFTPASNIKLYTAYACLKTLDDSLTSLRYTEKGDTIIFIGNADPTFLDEKYSHQPAFNFLDTTNKLIYYHPDTDVVSRYGRGWAWDDYQYEFQTEITVTPIYGNTVRFISHPNQKSPMIIPGFFKGYVDYLESPEKPLGITRDRNFNVFTYFNFPGNEVHSRDVPFKYSDELLIRLLSDTLNRKVNIYDKAVNFEQHIKSYPVKDLVSIMLITSNNFFAEELLLSCAIKKTNSTNINNIIGYVKSNHLFDLPDQLVWVDGSGLSRYNLTTPRNMVSLIEKMINDFGRDTVKNMLSQGGVTGTLKNWYKNGSDPYIFGKTGTLNNNHNLSGIIITDSGKELIFSFMNNNYTIETTKLKRAMQSILLDVKANY